jgi:cytochrome P450
MGAAPRGPEAKLSDTQMLARPRNDYDVSAIPLRDLNPSQEESWIDNSNLAIFKRLRAEAPVHWTRSPTWGEFWSVTRYQDIMSVDTNHGVFSSDVSNGGVGITNMPKEFVMPMFLASDPPKHTHQRLTVAPIFAPQRIVYLEKVIRERAGKLLDEVPVNEPFDWVDRISIELTTQMLTTLFDFPWEDRRKLTRWSDVAASTPGNGVIDSEEQRRTEMMECLQYFMTLWNERANAEPKADLISMLAHGESTRNMDPMEYLGNIILLMVGGNDTTRNTITGGLYALNLFPEEFANLRANPALIPDMVAEIVRWVTPIAYQRRTALKDTELAGTKIHKGDRVVMWYASGNRDETMFERPDDLIIDRPNARRNMSFGFGIHRCFGLKLAELQLRVVWEEILKRWDFIEVLEPPRRVYSSVIRGYSYMPVVVRA